MQTHTRFTLYATTAITCALGLPAPALASFTFTPPAGVPDYRLMFVTTDSTQAISANIATYNEFVTYEATLSPTLPATTWTAVASTPSVSAAANISCGVSCDYSVPIFLVDGTEVAIAADAMFEGAMLNPIDEDQSGNADYTYVWTGTNADGAAATRYELGAVGPFSFTGYSGYASGGAAFAFNCYCTSSDGLPLYAISAEIGAGNVPEPMTVSLLGFGAIALGFTRKLRRQHRLVG